MAPISINASENMTFHLPPMPCFLHACLYSVGEKIAFVLSLSFVFLVILLGNSLLCYLIFKEQKLQRSSTWISILNLAVSDMLIAVFCMPVLVIQIYLVESWQFGQAICKALPFFLNVGWISAITILTIISIEKFMAVCFPFRCFGKSSFVKVGIFLAWVTALVDSTYYTVKADKKVVTDYGEKRCVETWSQSEHKHFLVINIVLFYFIPLVIIIGLHAAIIIKLKFKTSRDLRENIANLQQRMASHRNSTEAVKVLLAIALCFAVFTTPYEVYTLYVLLISPQLLDFNTDFHLFAVTTWLFFFNISTHPFIYGLLSKKYKMALKKEFSIITFRTSEIRSPKLLQLERVTRENKQ